MASDDTKFSSQSLDRRSFNDTYGMYENIAYGVDGSNVTAMDGSGFKAGADLTITDTTVGDVETIVITDGVKTKTVAINNATDGITIVWT